MEIARRVFTSMLECWDSLGAEDKRTMALKPPLYFVFAPARHAGGRWMLLLIIIPDI